MARVTIKTLFKAFFATYVAVFIYSLTNFKSRIRITQPDFLFQDSNSFLISDQRKCTLRQSDLGDVVLNLSRNLDLNEIARVNTHLLPGGKWEPTDCEAWQRVAIIVPYRDRRQHLRILLNRLHPMLRQQKIAYQIFVVEQAGNEAFNKGRLLNVAFIEAMKLDNFDCIIMQDVDMIPETDKNIYLCDEQARHLSPAIDEMRYHPMYYNIYGGVIALSKENYMKINGFANRYAGWGSEDDDVSARTIGAGLQLTRPPYYVGRYKMVRHMKSYRSGDSYDNFMQWRYWWKKDGLSNLADIGYKVLSVNLTSLYTNITVDVGPPPPPISKDIPTESTLWFLWYFAP